MKKTAPKKTEHNKPARKTITLVPRTAGGKHRPAPDALNTTPNPDKQEASTDGKTS